jgi:hypothetical protein
LICSISASVPLYPLLNVLGTLTGSELDDPKVGQAVLGKRIFLDDGLQFPPTLADCHDDSSAVSELALERVAVGKGGLEPFQDFGQSGLTGLGRLKATAQDAIELEERHTPSAARVASVAVFARPRYHSGEPLAADGLLVSLLSHS